MQAPNTSEKRCDPGGDWTRIVVAWRLFSATVKSQVGCRLSVQPELANKTEEEIQWLSWRFSFRII